MRRFLDRSAEEIRSVSDMIFRRNLLALSRSNRSLGDLLLDAVPDPSIAIRRSKSGSLVPVALRSDREAPLHSLVDPEREAARLEEALPPGGFIVAFGLGAGFLLKRYLASSCTTGLLVVEYSAAMLRSILEEIDLSDLFTDVRFSIILDPSPEELRDAILSLYVPPIAGDIRSLPLRGRVDLDPEAFKSAAETLGSVLGSISDDYSVQAFFGKLWFKNAVRNLFAAERSSAPLPPVRRAAVAAAGPSLEDQIPALREAQAKGAFLIATDTSLPALMGRGLKPDAVVSIDCQHISYYHFLGGIPQDTPLILDLASPSTLCRLSDSVRFFSSGHPFCAYVSARWRPFPALDTSGGNVTHAALSLAEALGAESTVLAGADFSYPEGKSYARGTYIYGYFDQCGSRLGPLESHFTGFLFRGSDMERETDVDSAGQRYSRYLTKPFMAYREHLERFAARSPMEILPLEGKGVKIRAPVGHGKRERRLRRVFAAGSAPCPAAEFLKRYAKDLGALPAPRDPAIPYLGSLGNEERDLWTTLLPAASAFQREAGPGGMDAALLLELTRDWAIRTVEEALSEAPKP
jgi:hypothetical protein